MDPFDRTFLSAANVAGLSMASISRQIPLFRRCVGPGQTVLLLTHASRLDRPLSGEHLLVLTRERLVVTGEGRLFHRPHLHLDAAVADLRNVVWIADTRLTSIELSATAPDGFRGRFLIKVRSPGALWHLEAALGYVFRPTGGGLRKLNPAAGLGAVA
jgi:hypothetical protein